LKLRKPKNWAPPSVLVKNGGPHFAHPARPLRPLLGTSRRSRYVLRADWVLQPFEVIRISMKKPQAGGKCFLLWQPLRLNMNQPICTLIPRVSLSFRAGVGSLFTITSHMNGALSLVGRIDFILNFYVYLSMRKSDFSWITKYLLIVEHRFDGML